MTSLSDQGKRAREAARILAAAGSQQKYDALHAASESLSVRIDEILTANAKDVTEGESSGVSPTVIDRLRLDESRVKSMSNGLVLVAGLSDPVGEVTDGWVRPNGLRITRTRVPLGVVGIIYENRPNVTSDAAGLCIKSGNAAFLRGSSAAINSNLAIASALREGIVKAGLPASSIELVEETSRESAIEFMKLRGLIDCLIPRGGPSLIQSILENATVPFVIDGEGNCHIYVDESADLEMALKIAINAKTQRPSVCNAAESLIAHESIADVFLPKLAAAMPQVTLVGDQKAQSILPSIDLATESEYAHEFLDLKMSLAVVADIDQAIAHIARFGSGHSEAIITSDVATAQKFTNEVDAAAVLVNASTRFVDGEEFGFGAEIGISTQKLHCRGPMGLAQLTTLKYVVIGNGQVRT